LLAVFADETDFRDSDLLIDAVLGFLNAGQSAVEASGWIDAECPPKTKMTSK
jgi:hypothetical protein